MDLRRRSLLMTPIALAAGKASAQTTAAPTAPGVPPRAETLILENPEGTIRNAGWFNIWTVNAGGSYTGLQQLAMDALWYLDPSTASTGSGRTRWPPSARSTTPISPR